MRNSNIEKLRIVCIFMIITMHVFGQYQNVSDPIFRHTCIFVNAFCNSAVTIFILISGYYGIKTNWGKWVSLLTVTTFYGWFDLTIHLIPPPELFGGLDPKEFMRDLMPVFCNRYWFITSYMMLMALSGYIQKFIECLSRKEFLLLISILSLFVILSPTLFILEIFKDYGKGFVNMLTAYLIGRYISQYGFPEFVVRHNKVLVFLLAMSIFLLNECLYLIGLPGLFARDNNILILFLALSVFCFVIHLPYSYNKFINIMSGYNLSIYMVHLIFLEMSTDTIRRMLDVPPLIHVVVAIISLYTISVIIEYIRTALLGRMFQHINENVESSAVSIVQKYLRTANVYD